MMMMPIQFNLNSRIAGSGQIYVNPLNRDNHVCMCVISKRKETEIFGLCIYYDIIFSFKIGWIMRKEKKKKTMKL